jgi:hypothetical protein
MPSLVQRSRDPIWHVQIVVLIVIGLQLFTNSTLLPYNKYFLIALELALMIMVAIITPSGYKRISPSRRGLMITAIGIITIANAFSLLLLIEALFYGTGHISGRSLLLNGLNIYLTNILMFALWYWEIDGGGPDRRATNTITKQDFAFPQMIHPHMFSANWVPGFMDYLYLSVTNVANFAAADTLPLTHRAKLMMMTQSFVALVTVVLVAARAISIMN